VDVRFPDEDQPVERVQQAQQRLVEGLRSVGGMVIIDNLQPKRVQLVAEALNTTQSALHDGPYIVCTLNRSTDASVQALHTAHKFHLFALSHRLEAVRGFMTRYLRRRLAEAELNEHCQCGEQMRCVFDFLGKVLAKVNEVIERVGGGSDVTVGPRTFLQCPLEMETSREWFVELWNAKIVPYMQKVGGGEGIEDPTPYVCDQWPWLMVDGERPDRLVKSLREPNNCGGGGNSALQRRSTPNTSHCSSSLSSGYCSSIAMNNATSSGVHH